MRKRSVIVLAAAFVAALGGVIWWAMVSRPPAVPDPVYAGHPLSWWVGYSGRMPLVDSNALPYLLNALKKRDGPLRSEYCSVWPLFPQWVTKRVPRPLPAADLRANACQFLRILRPGARAAIPELLHLLRDDDDFWVRGNAAAALGEIADSEDKPVVEALLAATRDKDPTVRSFTVTALGDIANGEDKPVLEALLAATKDKNGMVWGNASRALWHLNPEAAAKAGVTNLNPAPITSPPPNAAGVGR